MTARCKPIVILAALAGCLLSATSAGAADLLSKSDLNRLGVQRYWHASVPLPAGESVARTALLDDNLYVLTDDNHVFAVHAATGIIRWSNLIADSGQTIRGPSHNDKYVFFTTPGGVRVFDRRTGELAGEPRVLRGVMIETMGDRATISIGKLHGVRREDVFNVLRKETPNDPDGITIAQLKITSLDSRRSKGRLIRIGSHLKVAAGDWVRASVVLPLKEVKMKFPPTCAVVADETRVFVGAANQRFYAYDILHGIEYWRFRTPLTVSSMPVLDGDDLFIGGQDGRVVSCTKYEKVKNWVFQTEGAIFADILVDSRHVYVASSDRSLYCLDRRTGRQVWRERFDTQLVEAPVLVGSRIYQNVPGYGLYTLDASTGKVLWHRERGGRCLAELDGNVYLQMGKDSIELVKVDARTGEQKNEVGIGNAEFIVANALDQSLLLTTSGGKMVCLRPADAPRLRPAQLAEVLRSDRKFRLKQKAKAPEPTKPADVQIASVGKKHWSVLFAEEDWLASRSTAKPAGGYGLVSPEGEKAETPEAVVEETPDEPEAMDEPEDDPDAWTFSEEEDEEEADDEEDEGDEDDEDEEDDEDDEDDEDEDDEDEDDDEDD